MLIRFAYPSQAYQGAAGENGSFTMNYSLEGDPSQQEEMVAAIELTLGVQTVVSGSGSAQPVGDGFSSDDGWN